MLEKKLLIVCNLGEGGCYSYNLINKYSLCNLSIENTVFSDEFH